MHHTWVSGSFASKSLTLSPYLNSLTATKPLEVELQIDAITLVNVSNFLYQLSFKMNRRFTVSTSYKGGPQYDRNQQKYIQNQTVISVEEEV